MPFGHDPSLLGCVLQELDSLNQTVEPLHCHVGPIDGDLVHCRLGSAQGRRGPYDLQRAKRDRSCATTWSWPLRRPDLLEEPSRIGTICGKRLNGDLP